MIRLIRLIRLGHVQLDWSRNDPERGRRWDRRAWSILSMLEIDKRTYRLAVDEVIVDDDAIRRAKKSRRITTGCPVLDLPKWWRWRWRWRWRWWLQSMEDNEFMKQRKQEGNAINRLRLIGFRDWTHFLALIMPNNVQESLQNCSRIPKDGAQVVDWSIWLWSSIKQVQRSLQNPFKVPQNGTQVADWLTGPRNSMEQVQRSL